MHLAFSWTIQFFCAKLLRQKTENIKFKRSVSALSWTNHHEYSPYFVYIGLLMDRKVECRPELTCSTLGIIEFRWAVGPKRAHQARINNSKRLLMVN